MGKDSNHHSDQPLTQSLIGATSEDPADGRGPADKPGAIGKTPSKKTPDNDAQNQATIEEFGREGLGVAPKE
jgi:hypothetical protein